jgi:hypothetical protein
MEYAEIIDGVVANIFVSDRPLFDNWVPANGCAVRDRYEEGRFIKANPPTPAPEPERKVTAAQVLAELTAPQIQKFIAMLETQGVIEPQAQER